MKLLAIERRWMHGVLDAMFPRHASDELPIGVMDLDVDGFLDEMLGSQTWIGAAGLRMSFALVALSPAMTMLTPRTMGGLPADARERALSKLYKSRYYLVRQFVMLTKATGAMLYCAAPQSRAVMLGDDAGQGRQP